MTKIIERSVQPLTMSAAIPRQRPIIPDVRIVSISHPRFHRCGLYISASSVDNQNAVQTANRILGFIYSIRPHCRCDALLCLHYLNQKIARFLYLVVSASVPCLGGKAQLAGSSGKALNSSISCLSQSSTAPFSHFLPTPLLASLAAIS